MTISTAIPASQVARIVGIKTDYKDLRAGNVAFLPQRVALIGQGNTLSTYATTKAQVFSALEVAESFGYGSPLHLAALQLLPTNGDGIGSIPLTVYPLEDDGAGVASDGDITPSVTTALLSTYTIRVNNIDSAPVVVPAAAVVADIAALVTAAINAVVEMPIIATDATTKVTFVSKWAGASANDVYVEVVGPTDQGVTWVVTQATNGANNPDVDDALNQIGAVWESMLLNCMDIADTATLTKYATWGEGRWLPETRKMAVVFTGNLNTTVANAIAVPDARKTDRTNAQLVAPGSHDLPFVTAARQLARIVKLANENPPHDYGSQQATGLVAGTDAEQWTSSQRQAAVLGGSSTVEVKDSVINISDVVTFYHPTGDPLPAYRHVVDIVKIQTIIFNTDLIFTNTEWDGAPLIPDDQVTVNPTAKKPKMAKAAVANMLDSLAANALISDPATAKASIQAGINEANPKRLDVSFTLQLVGNTNIISVDFNFGFYFGVAAAA